MSKEVIGHTEIRDKLILKKTLEDLGLNYNELSGEKLSWGTGYDKMMIDLATGKIHYDKMRKSLLNNVKQGYSKNFILTEIAKKGHRVESVNIVGNNIEVIAGY